MVALQSRAEGSCSSLRLCKHFPLLTDFSSGMLVNSLDTLALLEEVMYLFYGAINTHRYTPLQVNTFVTYCLDI